VSDLDLFQFAGDSLDPSHFGLAADGRAYVVAGPFAKTLGYRDAEKATRLLDADERGTQIVGTPGGDQRVSVIFEDGIWELIFRSTLPSAKSIKSRVKAILRELRETGVVDTREKPMTELEMARRYVVALERVAELEPAAHSWDTLAEASGDYSLREAAQILDRDPAISTGQNRLARTLRDLGWLDRRGIPYQREVDNGRISVRTTSYDHPRTGEAQLSTQIRVTVKGLHELHKRLGGRGPLLLAA
jgi:prophage antirepressor-like protein